MSEETTLADLQKADWTLGLTARVLGCLARAGITSIQELKEAFEDGRLYRLRNFGKKSYFEVRALLSNRFDSIEHTADPGSAYDVMRKIGLAQNALHKLAARAMKEDRSDGIRFAKYLDKYSNVYREIVDDLPLYSDISSEEVERLMELVR